MTHRLDVARGRDIVARWSALAEQRLEYLTELFESGRWRRYHSELALLENIREARAAVEIWRDLSMREVSRDGSAVDISRFDRPWAALPRCEVHWIQPRSAEIAAEPPRPTISIVAEAGRVGSEAAPSAPEIDDVCKLAPDRTIAERYPLLRNAL